MKSKTGFNPVLVLFCEKNKAIRCAIAFCRESPKLPILCLLSNGLYAKAVSRTDLPSSERIGVNLPLVFGVMELPVDNGCAFFAGIIILAAS